MGLLLYIISKILQLILTPVFYIYAIISLHNFKSIAKYFGSIAFSLDQLGNTMGAPIMNDVLLKSNPAKLYGNPDETISHVTGVNYLAGKCTWAGRKLAWLLDCIEPNHVENAATHEQ